MLMLDLQPTTRTRAIGLENMVMFHRFTTEEVLRDFAGRKPVGARRDAGAIEKAD